MRRITRWWLIFASCNLVVAAALVWTSATVIRLERAEWQARAETDYQESLRLALWRMDSWLSLFLAREAARPDADAGPLDSEFLMLHFDLDSKGIRTTPAAADASRIIPHLRGERLRAAFTQADSQVVAGLDSPGVSANDAAWVAAQQLKSQNEFDARVACSVPRPTGADSAGRQVVAWLDPPDAAGPPVLAFVRHIEGERFHGFVFDWPRVRERLLFEIRDLFPGAELVRATTVQRSANIEGSGLANAPVTLQTPPPMPIRVSEMTAGRAAVGLAWLALIGAAVAVGTTLQKSIDLGDRRRRFVSAVTHELRTPLTTFRMYTEMLADGLVRTEEQRSEYLQTLKDESHRLSELVANVLAHAQLEERRVPRRHESMNLDSLIDRLRPALTRRVASSGMRLDVAITSDAVAPLTVDPDAIAQILGNLVDNAAKYANGGDPATIHLGVAIVDGSIVLTVRDHGPGVPRDQARAIFAPFDRGGRDPSDPVPGVGLGLALSRGLARDMGGDLTLDAADGPGASFRLSLPTRPVRR